MIIPNVQVTVIKNGGFDQYGQEIVGTSKCEKCAIVKLVIKSDTTTVRVDSGATRHSAEEMIADAVLLMSANTCADIDDVIVTPHVSVRVKQKRARYAVTGRLDHWEVGCVIE